MAPQETNRSKDLMRLAITALEDGRDPFNESFLIENGVTLDEVYDLSDHLAMGARLWLYTLAESRKGGIYTQSAGLALAGAMSI